MLKNLKWSWCVIISKLEFSDSVDGASGGSKGGAPGAPPTVQNFLNFMQFFKKLGKIIGSCPLPRGLAPPPTENLGSAPGCKTRRIRKEIFLLEYESDLKCLLWTLQ